ncbi:MAG: hypothetical protein ACREBW_02310, partial [Candidatus Micrarchaeaceae archaeon]
MKKQINYADEGREKALDVQHEECGVLGDKLKMNATRRQIETAITSCLEPLVTSGFVDRKRAEDGNSYRLTTKWSYLEATHIEKMGSKDSVYMYGGVSAAGGQTVYGMAVGCFHLLRVLNELHDIVDGGYHPRIAEWRLISEATYSFYLDNAFTRSMVRKEIPALNEALSFFVEHGILERNQSDAYTITPDALDRIFGYADALKHPNDEAAILE